MQDASSIVPGGLRCTSIVVHSQELLDTLATTGVRVDVLCAVLLSHRVWCARLMGCGALHAGGTMATGYVAY